MHARVSFGIGVVWRFGNIFRIVIGRRHGLLDELWTVGIGWRAIAGAVGRCLSLGWKNWEGLVAGVNSDMILI